MNISDSLKEKFINRDGEKLIKIVFPSLNLTLYNANIYADTLKLDESIMAGNSIEFVGCIASTFSIDLHGVTARLKGQRIEVYITIGDWTESIPIFKGYVDSVKTRLSDSYKSITCYDDLYFKASDVDIASWYNSLTFPMTFLQFRNGLFNHLGMQQSAAVLPNDNISIRKQYIPSQMNALDTIKNICQFNGVFGKINRDGKFDYVSLSTQTNGTFPSTYTFPSLSLFPSGLETANTSDSTLVSYYREMEYEDYDVFAINKVLLRDSEDDVGIAYATGDNVYIVQGNIFAFGLSDTVKTQVAKNIYDNVSGFNYNPFDSVAIGLPFVETGSLVTYHVADYTGQSGQVVNKSFYVMNRTMKGIQDLTDNYSANGEQYQKIFLSDIGSKLDSLQTRVNSAATVGQMSEMIEQMETPTGFTVVSCNTLPSSRSANTIYLIRGDITVL